MKKALVIGSFVGLAVLLVLLYRYTSKTVAIARIREKWGAANPVLVQSDQPFAGKSLSELNDLLAVGAPGWLRPGTTPAR